MLRKVKNWLAQAGAFLTVLALAGPAWAENNQGQTAGIAEKTAQEVGEKVVNMTNTIVMPLGSAIIFISIVVVAAKIIMSANKPDERAKAIGSIPYILGGGVLLGGAMLVAGFIVNMMVKAGQ